MKQNYVKFKLRNTIVNIVVLGGLVTLSTGCISATRAIGIDTSSNKQQDICFAKGDYNKSAALACKDKDKDAKIDNDNLLPTLKAGNAYLFAKDYNASTIFLNEAENIIKYQREQQMLGSIADYTAKLLLNDAAIEFNANMTDSIMLNTYKSLALMSEYKFDDARVELNRAIDRQRRAKEVYAKLIGKQEEVIKEKSKKKAEKSNKRSKKNSFDFTEGFTKTLNNQDIRKKIDSHYSNLKSFQAYPDFVNPFTTYLAGLYFEINGDYQKSVDLLKEASAMMPKNTVIASDFQMVDAALSGKKITKKYVWVIFENGLAPIKTEFRIDIPVFLVTKKVKYVGIALPKFKSRAEAYPFISVTTSQQKSVHTQVVANMDRVMLTEFKYGYNDIITRAILSTTLKAFAQYVAQKNGGGLLGTAVGLFSALTTHADTRSWSTLPKNFQVARVEMPKNGLLSLKLGENLLEVQIAKNAKNAIVYVRVPTAISIPSLSVINF